MDDQRSENLKSFLNYLERIESDIDKLQVIDNQVNLDTMNQKSHLDSLKSDQNSIQKDQQVEMLKRQLQQKNDELSELRQQLQRCRDIEERIVKNL
jgi:predicted  nucleic acid-binding Zn-ribbon protein